MTPQLPHETQRAEHRILLLLTPSLVFSWSLLGTVDSMSLAGAAECQVTEEGETIQSLRIWKGAVSSPLPRIDTVDQDAYGELVPSPIQPAAQYMKSNRIALGNTVNRVIAPIGSCVSRDIPKSALFNRAMIRPTAKIQAKVYTQVMKVSALPYNGKGQVVTIRTTPTEIRVSARNKVPITIGPDQEIWKSSRFNERNAGQAVASLSSTVESPSLFGNESFVSSNLFQNAIQMPDNESLRMNLTTEQVLHNGNCANGCP